jgi:phytoene/squalene synthetase
MAQSSYEFEHQLKQVSRSFFLTIRVLPHSIRRQIGIAYLLARAADTIADTQLVQVPRRQAALTQLLTGIGEACQGRESMAPDLGNLAEAQDTLAGK